MIRGYEVRNTVCDHARFAASGTSQNQHRTVGSRYCFALLRVEAREEIHCLTIFAFAGAQVY